MSEELTLGPTVEDDLPTLFEFQREPEANAMAAFPPRDRDAYMEHWHRVLSMESVVACTIRLGDTIVGSIGSFEADEKTLVGYWIGSAWWGRGIATRALEMFVAAQGERPLHAWVAKRNTGSIRVLEKCGFVLEDEGESPAPTGGEPVEEFLYALSDDT